MFTGGKLCFFARLTPWTFTHILIIVVMYVAHKKHHQMKNLHITISVRVQVLWQFKDIPWNPKKYQKSQEIQRKSRAILVWKLCLAKFYSRFTLLYTVCLKNQAHFGNWQFLKKSFGQTNFVFLEAWTLVKFSFEKCSKKTKLSYSSDISKDCNFPKCAWLLRHSV